MIITHMVKARYCLIPITLFSPPNPPTHLPTSSNCVQYCMCMCILHGTSEYVLCRNTHHCLFVRASFPALHSSLYKQAHSTLIKLYTHTHFCRHTQDMRTHTQKLFYMQLHANKKGNSARKHSTVRIHTSTP